MSPVEFMRKFAEASEEEQGWIGEILGGQKKRGPKAKAKVAAPKAKRKYTRKAKANFEGGDSGDN